MHKTAARVWTTITVDQLERLNAALEDQKGQLSLALLVLASLGFDLGDFADLRS